MPAPTTLGIYPSDSVADVAQSLPIDPLGAGAADLLAGDVEFRIHLILQEAKKSMYAAKRGTLLPEDLENAMESLNVEPIIVPPQPLPQTPWVDVPPTTGPQHLYYVPDEEIDFATYLKQPLPAGLASSAGMRWKGHWLAVEGVQPAIPENPPPARAGPSRPLPVPSTGPSSLKQSAKTHLPSDLQLYFTRLTASLIPSTSAAPRLPAPPTDPNTQSLADTERVRLAALANVREDTAISGILVYLVKWIAESIIKCLPGSTGTMGCLIDTVEAVLDNEGIFIEPYIHQFLAPLCSVILTVPLGPHPASTSQPSPFDIRSRASDALGKIAQVYGQKYPALLPRLLSTFSEALRSSPFPSPLGAQYPPAGRYEGAALALGALGPQAVRSGLCRDDGLRYLDSMASRLYPGEKESRKNKNQLMKAVLKSLSTLTRPKPEGTQAISGPSYNTLQDELGPMFAAALQKRPWLASELLRLKREGGLREEAAGMGMQLD